MWKCLIRSSRKSFERPVRTTAGSSKCLLLDKVRTGCANGFWHSWTTGPPSPKRQRVNFLVPTLRVGTRNGNASEPCQDTFSERGSGAVVPDSFPSRLAVQNRQHAFDGFFPIVPTRGRGEVDVQSLLSNKPDERPVIGKSLAVDVAQMIEDHPAAFAETGRHLELTITESSCGSESICPACRVHNA